MIELIASVIFILSLGGIIFILARKVPVLVRLPQNGTSGIKDHRMFLSAKEKIKDIYFGFKKQVSLHKFLSFAKVTVLKIETQIDHLLHKIRKEAKEKRENDLKK
jgi:hypothetical protein